jgi:hypothetical protein
MNSTQGRGGLGQKAGKKPHSRFQTDKPARVAGFLFLRAAPILQERDPKPFFCMLATWQAVESAARLKCEIRRMEHQTGTDGSLFRAGLDNARWAWTIFGSRNGDLFHLKRTYTGRCFGGNRIHGVGIVRHYHLRNVSPRRRLTRSRYKPEGIAETVSVQALG